METERESTRFKPVSVFMLFGTQGDVYPIAAIAAAFACDQEQYPIVLITQFGSQGSMSVYARSVLLGRKDVLGWSCPRPLKRNYLLPNENDDNCVREAGNMLARAINHALFPKVKTHVSEIAERLSLEDGMLEALKILKEEISCSNSTRH